eukprot:jgi/Ulvmu1/9654/UM054_0086.1
MSLTCASLHIKRTQRVRSPVSACSIPQSTPATVLKPISPGDMIPNVMLAYFDAQDNLHEEMSHELFRNKTVCVIGVPGAFLPTCSMKHIPSFVDHSDALRKDKSIDEILCISVNDVFVMDAWGKSLGADEAGIVMVADGCGQFALAMGVELDLTEKGMGVRSRRYSMVVDNLEIKLLNLEDGGAYNVSDSETLLNSSW